MTQPYSFSRSVCILIIAFIALIAVLPMLLWGMPGGNDRGQHFQFAAHVYDAVSNGQIFPSVAGLANNGLGDVGIRFYPPFAYYLLSVSFAVFGDWASASIFVFFLIFFFGSLGVFLWTALEFSKTHALAAAALYAFAPFHLNEIYNNFLFAEFAASAVLPFCFYFLTRIYKHGAIVDVAGFASALALLFITHLPMTIIGSLALGVYTLALYKSSLVSAIPKLLVSLLIALALSSFYWIRIVNEIEWVKHSQSIYFSGIWDYRANYLFVVDRIGTLDDLSLWLGDLMLVAVLVSAVPSVILLIKRKTAYSPFLFSVSITLLFGIVMTTPISAPIWDNFTLLQKVQFPWRWLNVISLFGSVFFAVGLVEVSEILKSSKSLMLQTAVGVSLFIWVVLSAFVVKGPHYTPAEEFNKLAGEASHSETFEGWLPIWADRRATSLGERVLSPGREETIKTWSSDAREFTLAAGTEGSVTVSTFFYPHWKLTVNDRVVTTVPGKFGTIEFTAPAESVDVQLVFAEPTVNVIAIYVASGTALSMIFLLISLLFKTRGYFGLSVGKLSNAKHD